jgi:hypothetical protein
MAERGVPISEAARVMGVSVDALRKRVQRRSVKAYKDADGQWRVVLPGRDNGREDIIEGDLPETPPETARGEVDRIRRAGGIAAVQEVLAPFIAELGTVREELGREKERREQAERERDQLRLEVARLQSVQRHNQRRAVDDSAPVEESPPTIAETPQRGAERGLRAFWRKVISGP